MEKQIIVEVRGGNVTNIVTNFGCRVQIIDWDNLGDNPDIEPIPVIGIPDEVRHDILLFTESEETEPTFFGQEYTVAVVKVFGETGLLESTKKFKLVGDIVEKARIVNDAQNYFIDKIAKYHDEVGVDFDEDETNVWLDEGEYENYGNKFTIEFL